MIRRLRNQEQLDKTAQKNLAETQAFLAFRHGDTKKAKAFLHEGIQFSRGDVLLLGKWGVERTWHVLDQTSELFMDSGDDNAFELFDVSGFVFPTADGFVLKKEVKVNPEVEDFDQSVQWVEYYFTRT